jgi:hypothetical protein
MALFSIKHGRFGFRECKYNPYLMWVKGLLAIWQMNSVLILIMRCRCKIEGKTVSKESSNEELESEIELNSWYVDG